MKIKPTHLLLSAILVLPTIGTAKYCKNFSSQQEAQAYFLSHHAKNLDRDDDGIACEHLRGGSTKKSHSSNKTPQKVKPKAKESVEEKAETIAPKAKKKKTSMRLPYVAPIPIEEAETTTIQIEEIKPLKYYPDQNDTNVSLGIKIK